MKYKVNIVGLHTSVDNYASKFEVDPFMQTN